MLSQCSIGRDNGKVHLLKLRNRRLIAGRYVDHNGKVNDDCLSACTLSRDLLHFNQQLPGLVPDHMELRMLFRVELRDSTFVGLAHEPML